MSWRYIVSFARYSELLVKNRWNVLYATCISVKSGRCVWMSSSGVRFWGWWEQSFDFLVFTSYFRQGHAIKSIVYQSVCQSVCPCAELLPKIIRRFLWSLTYWAYQSKELVNFWWWSGTGYGFQITFPRISPLRNRDLGRFISVSRTVTGRFLRHSAKRMTQSRWWNHNILAAIRQTPG